jgi:ribonuclease HII
MIDLHYELDLWMNGIVRVAGIDEAGRGPLAGPVVAAAVVFPSNIWIEGVDDSKKLSPDRRQEMYEQIKQLAVGVGVGIVDPQTIDRINILQATHRAMDLAVSRIMPAPNYLLVDGRGQHEFMIPSTAIVDGDARCFSIAAASIIAKVTRDRLMEQFDREFPEYGFAQHKGYGTRQHYDALERFGPCAIHRRSFRLSHEAAAQ